MVSFCLLLSLAGCDKPALETSTDIDLLDKMIGLPASPVEACFTIETLGDGVFGPSDYRLTALLRFDTASLAALDRAVPPIANGAEVLGVEARLVEPCKPLLDAALSMPVCHARPIDICFDGAERLAAAFYKSPYLNGKAFRVADGDWFVVILHTQ